MCIGLRDEFPKQLSAHEIGLKDLIDAAYLLGNVPDIYLVAITVKDFQNLGTELSPEVSASIPVAADEIRRLVKNLNEG